MVMGSLYSIVIIQGLLLVGVIDKKSGFLEPWLFVSFIAIIGLAVNFGYVSWFTGLPFIFIMNDRALKFIFFIKISPFVVDYLLMNFNLMNKFAGFRMLMTI